MAHIPDVVFNECITLNDVRGGAIIRVLVKEVKVRMSPGVIIIETIVPLFSKLDLSKGKRFANDSPTSFPSVPLKARVNFTEL